MKQTIASVEYAAKVRVIIVFQIYIEQETEKLNKIWEFFFVQFSPAHLSSLWKFRTASRKDIMMRLAVTLSKGKNKVASATQLLIISLNIVGC